MLAKTGSVALVGVDARLVDVEVDINTGVPKFTIVGLPAKSITEAQQRTRSALEASSERWPPARVVANLAPAGLRKDGTHFDLPIALGLIAGDKRLDPEAIQDWVVIGELALNGAVRPVRGALAAAIACKEGKKRGLICPAANASEAALITGVDVVPVESLANCVSFLRGGDRPRPSGSPARFRPTFVNDMSDVRGQATAKFALEVAAAGGHNLLLSGPPGSGKTMLAHRLPSILPPMSLEESLEVTRIHSVAGFLLEDAPLITARPFRSPHHHITPTALIGGGAQAAVPGEVTLAHQGVLFLDEIALYRRDVLESLRGPIEDGVVRVARLGGAISYPCRFALIAAMNPCPCGRGEPGGMQCICKEYRLNAYRAHLSGPLLDRFDMRVRLLSLPKDQLLRGPEGEPSSSVRSRVEEIRARQAERYGSPLIVNASAASKDFEAAMELSAAGKRAFSAAIDRFSMTGRGIWRVLRVARTVADLNESDQIAEEHVLRAVSFRQRSITEGVAA